MSFKVEKNITIPDPPRGIGSNMKYPWPDLGHGDSFFVPCEPEDMDRTYRTVTNSGKEWIRRHHKGERRIIGRTLQEEGGVRFWMVFVDQPWPLVENS